MGHKSPCFCPQSSPFCLSSREEDGGYEVMRPLLAMACPKVQIPLEVRSVSVAVFMPWHVNLCLIQCRVGMMGACEFFQSKSAA